MKHGLWAIGALAALAGRAAADPATLVSFSWSTSGITDASATASCLTPPEFHCMTQGGCSSPTPTFGDGGTSMVYTLRSLSAASSCTFVCNCCSSGGGSGSGDARSDCTIINPTSSASLSQWIFSDRLYIGGRATGFPIPQCVTGSGSGLGLGTYEFDLTFETTSTTRLILSREHYVNVLNFGSATSSYSLSRVEPIPATLFTQTLSRTSGAESGDGQTIVVLTPGTYNVHIVGRGEVAAHVDDGTGSVGGSLEVWFGCNMRVEPYECPVQTDAPDGLSACVGRNASFSVAAQGSSLHYQWRRNGVPLVGGLTPAGTTTYGQWLPTLTLVGLKGADAGVYDCLMTNDCGSIASDGAELRVCAVDFDCDSTVDFFDYDAFVIAFEQGDTRADFDADGSVDFFDYDAFVVAFERGC